ncbi:MAG: hypothetical protein ACD_20C00414G0004 [uncultured bacterium]|nr:MAG: hypothetical protein ACD_20C00414G0004 [uncultured bacterium]
MKYHYIFIFSKISPVKSVMSYKKSPEENVNINENSPAKNVIYAYNNIICPEIKTEKNQVTIFSAERKRERVVKNEEKNQRILVRKLEL